MNNVDGRQCGKEGGQQCVILPHNNYSSCKSMQNYLIATKVGQDFVGILKHG